MIVPKKVGCLALQSERDCESGLSLLSAPRSSSCSQSTADARLQAKSRARSNVSCCNEPPRSRLSRLGEPLRRPPRHSSLARCRCPDPFAPLELTHRPGLPLRLSGPGAVEGTSRRSRSMRMPFPLKLRHNRLHGLRPQLSAKSIRSLRCSSLIRLRKCSTSHVPLSLVRSTSNSSISSNSDDSHLVPP